MPPYILGDIQALATIFMRILATILFLFFSIPVFSQNGGIKGRLIAKNDKADFMEIEMQLLKGDNSVKCAMVDQCGDFQIDNIRPGTYRLQLFAYGKIAYDDLIVIEADKIEQLNLSHPGSTGQSKKVCPKGHIDSLIPIAYGLPGEELIRRSEIGEVRLGGCMMGQSKWYCKKHKIEF